MSQILSFVSLVLKTTESLFSRAAVNFNDKFYIALVAPELFLFSGCKNCILRITDTLRSKCSYKYFVVVENLKQRFLKAFWFSLETRFGSPRISLAFTPISFFFFFKFMIFHFQDIHGEKCPKTELFLVGLQENTARNNSVFGHFFRSDQCQHFPENFTIKCFSV